MMEMMEIVTVCMPLADNISITLLPLGFGYRMLARSGILLRQIPEYVYLFRKHIPYAQ
jgi:hypothetical protein